MNRHPLSPLLQPESVAVVGASQDDTTVGGALMRNLRHGFQGPVYAVNPSGRTIDGLPAYRSLTDLPSGVDLVVIAAPSAAVASTLEECGRRGVSAAAILTSQTDHLETAIAAARRHGVRVLGPNSLGVMPPVVGLNATFAASGARPGTVALVAQSGAMVSAVLDWADVGEVGFSSVVSLGNKADVDFADLLDFLAFDALTESIVLYVEGIRNARKFLSALRAAARVKPVIVLKSGREPAGSQAAATHTGSMAARDDVFDAALRRSGAVRVRTFVQLFSAAKCLASRFRPTGNRMAIVTNGGGLGVMAADRAAELGIQMAALEAASVARLHRVLPPGSSGNNPVDLLEDADVARYREGVAACLEDPQVDGVLVILAPQAMTRPLAIAQMIVALSGADSKPLFACWMGDRSVHGARHVLASAGVPVFRTPEPAVEAFANVASYYENQQQLMQVPGPLGAHEPPDIEGASKLIAQGLSEHRRLSETQTAALLQAFHIPIVPAKIAATADEAAALAAEIGFPVAMKVHADAMVHKQAAGAVRLWIDSPTAAQAAYGHIVLELAERVPGVEARGVAVQSMVDKPGAAECLIGISRDPLFGPVVMFGTGGTAVELIADLAVGLPPLNRFLARHLMLRTRMGRLLASEGREAEILAIERLLLRVSEMACELPQLQELDINPFIVDANGGVAVDARAVIHAPATCAPGDRYAHMAVHPYPMDLVANWNSPQGVRVEIRPIRPEDAQIERAFVRRLSGESRYFRFISALHELSDRMLVRFTQIDYDREMALVAVTKDGDQDLQIAVARYSIRSGGDSCEFALAVDDAWHGKGLGTRLMKALMQAAAAKGLDRMEGFVLHNNVKMLGLMHKLGFDIRTDPEDPSLKVVTKRLVAGDKDTIM